MTWHEVYKSIPPPAQNPCAKCRTNGQCDKICPARAKWWDVVMKKLKEVWKA